MERKDGGVSWGRRLSEICLLSPVHLVDISRNALGFNCISRLQCCAKAKNVEMNVEGKYENQGEREGESISVCLSKHLTL